MVPGYRVEGVTAGASNKYCCRVWGHFNSVNNTCDVKSCAQVVTSFTSYVKSTDSYKDCYAEYVCMRDHTLIEARCPARAGQF